MFDDLPIMLSFNDAVDVNLKQEMYSFNTIRYLQILFQILEAHLSFSFEFELSSS